MSRDMHLLSSDTVLVLKPLLLHIAGMPSNHTSIVRRATPTSSMTPGNRRQKYSFLSTCNLIVSDPNQITAPCFESRVCWLKHAAAAAAVLCPLSGCCPVASFVFMSQLLLYHCCCYANAVLLPRLSCFLTPRSSRLHKQSHMRFVSYTVFAAVFLSV